MMKFSVCMIVKDEEAVLARCLDGVKNFADELIIVDTGSADATKEIAHRYTDYVYDFVWTDNFADARNYSYSFATCDYIMWVDADEVIDIKSADKINQLKTDLTPEIITIFMLDDMPENGGYSMRGRLELRNSNPVWVGALHECIPLRSNYLETDIVIRHQKSGDNNAAAKLTILSDLLANIEEMDFRLKINCWLDLHRRNKAQEAELVYKHCLREAQNTSFVDTAGCLLIGTVLQNAHEYQNAINWYEMAMVMFDKPGSDATKHELFQILQRLVKCNFYLGKKDAARLCNEMAGKLKPSSQSVKINALALQ